MIAVDGKYIDVPFERFNCWEFVCHYYLGEFDIRLPLFSDEYTDANDNGKIHRLYKRETANRAWPQVAVPQYPDLATFKINGYLWHVGIVVGDNYMLHSQKKINSVIEKYNSIRWKNRLYGFFRYKK